MSELQALFPQHACKEVSGAALLRAGGAGRRGKVACVL